MRSHVYLDDPMWIALGPALWRRRAFALIVLSLRALCLKVSWKKCERGRRLNWVGVDFVFNWAAKRLIMGTPPDCVQDLAAEAKDILFLSMVGTKRLRSFAGKLSWVAGVVTRLRWAVAGVCRSRRHGMGPRRVDVRHDQREKRGLVATRRCRGALQWIALAMDDLTRRPLREVDLASGPPLWAIVADA